LIWSAYQVSDLEGVEKLAREGKIRTLPRMGEKHEAKLLKAIEDYRRIAGRFLLDVAEGLADKLVEYLLAVPGVEKSRLPGRCAADAKPSATSTSWSRARLHRGGVAAEDHRAFAELSRPDGHHRARRQQGQLPAPQRHAGGRTPAAPESFGAAMQYFTGSKAHNVALRQRALKMALRSMNTASLASKTRNRSRARRKKKFTPS